MMKLNDSIDCEGFHCSNNNHHYDMCQILTIHFFMNRSEGLLGVITRVAIQTQQLPKFVDVCLVQCSSFDRVIQTYVLVETFVLGFNTTILVRRHHIFIYMVTFFFLFDRHSLARKVLGEIISGVELVDGEAMALTQRTFPFLPRQA